MELKPPSTLSNSLDKLETTVTARKLTAEELTPPEDIGAPEAEKLRREFKPRQISMFAIACAIGTGLIIGSGTALMRGGPGSLFIAYSLVDILVYYVMTCMSEMAAFLPMEKGFGGYAARFVDPALGYVSH